MTDDPDTLLRRAAAGRQAKDQALIERITGHHAARAMLADAMSRADDEPELTDNNNQEETNAG